MRARVDACMDAWLGARMSARMAWANVWMHAWVWMAVAMAMVTALATATMAMAMATLTVVIHTLAPGQPRRAQGACAPPGFAAHACVARRRATNRQDPANAQLCHGRDEHLASCLTEMRGICGLELGVKFRPRPW